MMTSGEQAGSDTSCFACILAPVARLFYPLHLYWMDSGFFIPSGSRGHAHLLVLCWLNEHVRFLTWAGMTCRPIFTLTAVHLKTHSCKMLTDTICHRPSGPLTDSRGRWEGAVVRYKIAAGNSLDHNTTATSQIPGQTPWGPTQSLWCDCPPFAGISHANTFSTSNDFQAALHLELCLHGKSWQNYLVSSCRKLLHTVQQLL